VRLDKPSQFSDSRQAKESTPVQRVRSFWVIWFLLAVMSSNIGGALFATTVDASQSSDPTPVLAGARAGRGNLLSESVSSASREFSLQNQRQSKKVRMLIRRGDTVHQSPQEKSDFRLIRMPAFLPVRFFFPRKLSPPSASEDPFLS
jgi:hypothetical protein